MITNVYFMPISYSKLAWNKSIGVRISIPIMYLTNLLLYFASVKATAKHVKLRLVVNQTNSVLVHPLSKTRLGYYQLARKFRNKRFLL